MQMDVVCTAILQRLTKESDGSGYEEDIES